MTCLPDETSLALALASELAHIGALAHRTQTQFAFSNQTMLSDFDLLKHLRFEHPPAEMLAASQETISIMQASPYQKTANAGLFLKALGAQNGALPRLLQANLGDQVADPEALARLAGFAAAAPALGGGQDRADRRIAAGVPRESESVDEPVESGQDPAARAAIFARKNAVCGDTFRALPNAERGR